MNLLQAIVYTDMHQKNVLPSWLQGSMHPKSRDADRENLRSKVALIICGAFSPLSLVLISVVQGELNRQFPLEQHAHDKELAPFLQDHVAAVIAQGKIQAA